MYLENHYGNIRDHKENANPTSFEIVQSALPSVRRIAALVISVEVTFAEAAT